MPTENMTAYVLADNEAPENNKRESRLQEAFGLLAQLNEDQLRFLFADFNLTL